MKNTITKKSVFFRNRFFPYILILLLLSSFASAQIIFEDDFSNDGGWVGSPTTTWTSSGAPSNWSAYKRPPNSVVDIVNNEGVGGTKPALRLGYQINSASAALSLGKHLTGNYSTGYSELYIRYQVRFDNNWKIGNGTDYQSWKWLRLWQHRTPNNLDWSEDEVYDTPKDTRYMILNIHRISGAYKPGFNIDFSDNVNDDSNGGPLYQESYYPYDSSSTGGSMAAVNEWAITPEGVFTCFPNCNQGWHTIEWHVKLCTSPCSPSTADSEYELWIDGIKQKEPSQKRTKNGMTGNWINPPTESYGGGINFITVFDNNQDWSNYWNNVSPSGWPTGVKYLYLNDVVISTSYIGPNYVIGGGTPLQSCSSQGGSCCQGGYICSGSTTPSSDCSICCIGACQQPMCTDSDHDTYNLSQSGCGTADCNDLNPSINPSAAEICNDSLDNDCDGNADCQDSDCSNQQICAPQQITAKFNSTAGDGDVINGQSTWAATRDSASGTTARPADTNIYAVRAEGGASYTIARGFFPFDTSAIPDNATIVSANLYLYLNNLLDQDNDNDDYIAVVQTIQSSTATLSNSDFNKAGDVDGGHLDLTGLSTGRYYFIPLNPTGIGWISKTGFTKIGTREGHDLINSPIAVSGNNWFKAYAFEQGSNKPYLEVVYITQTSSNCTDNDGDGYGVGTGCLGSDCDDGNGNVHQTITCTDYSICGIYDLCVLSCPAPPTDICGNGIDEDCDGIVANCTSQPNVTGIIFEDNFDGHSDWSSSTVYGLAESGFSSTKNLVLNPPGSTSRKGWLSYRSDTQNLLGNPTLQLSSINARSGKSLKSWYEGFGASVGGGIDLWLGDHGINQNKSGYDEIYIRGYFKFDPLWLGGSNISWVNGYLKVMRLYTGKEPDYGTIMPSSEWSNDGTYWGICQYTYLVLWRDGKGLYRLGFHIAGDNDVSKGGIACIDAGSGAGPASIALNPLMGGWIPIQWYVRLNDPGQSNGTEKIWINNNDSLNPTWEKTGLNIRTTADRKFNLIVLLDNLQGFSSNPRAEQYLAVDDLVISTKYIPDDYVIGGNQTQNQTCTDNDLDTYNLSQSGCGIPDCNDSNFSINPLALELCGNGVDENCDGIDLQCNKADINKNNCVDSNELSVFVQRWFKSSADVSMRELVSAIKEWKKGC